MVSCVDFDLDAVKFDDRTHLYYFIYTNAKNVKFEVKHGFREISDRLMGSKKQGFLRSLEVTFVVTKSVKIDQNPSRSVEKSSFKIFFM